MNGLRVMPWEPWEPWEPAAVRLMDEVPGVPGVPAVPGGIAYGYVRRDCFLLARGPRIIGMRARSAGHGVLAVQISCEADSAMLSC